MRRTKKTKRFNAAHEVYERIVFALKSGVAPWKKPWVDGAAPMNVVTKRSYNGFNCFSLNLVCIERGYSTGRFLTFEQCKRLGGRVKKGEKAEWVVWRDLMHPAKKDDDGAVLRDGAGVVVRDMDQIMFVDRHYAVFNIEQCDGLPSDYFAVSQAEVQPIESAEKIVREYRNGPSLLHGGDEAYYSPTKDIVCLPPMSQFKNAESYYGTLFHELVHSTGQKTRLDRDMNGVFGTPSYAFEELIAEIGSSVLCNDCGVCPDLGNAAAYCDSWLKCFVDGTIKKKQMLSAFSKAWAAVKYMRESV